MRCARCRKQRFLATVKRGWEIPFFQRHWRAAGLEPGDIRSLDDLQKIPPYSVHEIRESIERNPPFGDFMGMSPEDGKRMPLVLQTSGGTTGLPRPMLYAPVDRETMAILGGRRFALHGIRPGDLVLVTYALGLSNGGMAPREALWRYTGAVPVMAGSGASTPTRRQVELIQAWKINVILGFPAYLRHMALVARDEMGIDVRTLGIRLIGTHLGREDRRQIEQLWDAPCFDMYGTHESGMMGAECQHQSGLHVQEDAFILEVADPDTGRILPDGEKGTLYITTLYKWGAPQIRFNVNDISAYATDDLRVRQLDAATAMHLRARRQHGEAARRQCVSRGGGCGGSRRCPLEWRVLLRGRSCRRSGHRRNDGHGGGARHVRRCTSAEDRPRTPHEGSAWRSRHGRCTRQWSIGFVHRHVAYVQSEAVS